MKLFKGIKQTILKKSLRNEFGVIWQFFYNNVIAYFLLYIQNYLINKYMPIESLGEFSYTQSLLILFTSIYSMEAYSAYLRFIGINNEKQLLKLIRRLLYIASAIFSITVFLFFDSPLYVLFVGYIWMRERLYFFRSKMDITTYGRIKIIQYALSVFAIIGLSYFNLLNHKTALVTIGVSYIVVAVLYTFNNKAKRTTVEDDNLPKVDSKEIIKYALPLSFNAIVVWLLGAADQMLIDNYLDPLTLTYYSVGFRIINVIRIGVGVIMEYWPRFYFERMEKKEFSDIRVMKLIFFAIVMFLCVGTVLLSKPLYILMGASQYVAMRWMFCYLAIAEMLRQWGAILFTFQSFMKNTSINVIVLSLLGGLKFGINLLTIKDMGVNVLFYSTLICYFIYFLISLYFGYYKEKRYTAICNRI